MHKTFGLFDNLLDKELGIKIDLKELPAGEYTFYATYGGHVYNSYQEYGRFYAPAISNKITVKIDPNNAEINPVKKFDKNVFIFTDIDNAIENSIVTINLNVIDRDYTPITEGIVRIYGDYERTVLIGTVNLAKGTSFKFKVPQCAESLRSEEIPIWYTYERYDEKSNTLYYAKDNSEFNTLKTNNLNISAKASKNTKIIDGILNLVEGESIIIRLDNIDFWECSPISIHVEGMDKTFGVFSNLWNKELEIKLDPNEFPAGEYTFYAKYGGHVYDCSQTHGRFYAPATSNKITVKINPVNAVMASEIIPICDIPIANIMCCSLLSTANVADKKDYEKQAAYGFFECNYGMENSIVKITPIMLDKYHDVISGGILKVYSDYHRTELIAAIDLDNCTSFEYAVPECVGVASSKSIPIFYTFEKYDDENNILYEGSDSFMFHSMNTNDFTINVKDSQGKDAENGTIEINEGDSITLEIDNLNFKTGSSTIRVYVEGNDDYICGFNFDYMNHEITFDQADFPNGEYVIYAVCQENVGDGYYYAQAISNKITVKIVHELDIFEILSGFINVLNDLEVPVN